MSTLIGCPVQELLEADPSPAEEGPGDPGARQGPRTAGLVVVGLLAAAAGGWFGAPKLAPKASAVLESFRGGASAEGDAEEVEEPSSTEHLLSNLVLNPAGSGGVRFLVASLALVVTEEAGAVLEARDAEARDLVLTVLSARTVEELSDVSRRDEIRQELRSELNGMLGFDGVRQIFFPQFVIQ